MPLSALIGILIGLILLSAFFSSSETGLMSLNRYRLRHLAQAGHRGAILAEQLLQRPDRIIGLILIGNTLANITASVVTTIIALRLWGEAALAAATGVLTLLLLIFSEVAPKTLAALHPERVAFPAAFIYWPLLKLFYPVVWTINTAANGLLRLMRIHSSDEGNMALSAEELRTVVMEAGAIIPQRHQRMLLSILDLEKVTVEDIMVPRNEIVGIDITDDWDRITAQLISSQHTRLPIYEETIDNIIGILHLRRVLHKLANKQLDRAALVSIAQDAYFIPEGVPLNTQLLNFQRRKRRIGLVVDEYGDIQGLVTLEDILEEIVGEFTTDPASMLQDVMPQDDGSYIINASISIRTLNRLLSWNLPTSGPKTLNGLILEHMETIPEPGTSMKFGEYLVEILKSRDNAVQAVRMRAPPKRRGAVRLERLAGRHPH
jgi:Mg2+/Co2+ transporter CorB